MLKQTKIHSSSCWNNSTCYYFVVLGLQLFTKEPLTCLLTDVCMITHPDQVITCCDFFILGY